MWKTLRDPSGLESALHRQTFSAFCSRQSPIMKITTPVKNTNAEVRSIRSGEVIPRSSNTAQTTMIKNPRTQMSRLLRAAGVISFVTLMFSALNQNAVGVFANEFTADSTLTLPLISHNASGLISWMHPERRAPAQVAVNSRTPVPGQAASVAAALQTLPGPIAERAVALHYSRSSSLVCPWLPSRRGQRLRPKIFQITEIRV